MKHVPDLFETYNKLYEECDWFETGKCYSLSGKIY